MTDEQPTVETTTLETPEVEPIDSEVVNTQEDTSGKGDLNEALRQAREEARQLKANLANPEFIYSQARQLGLTEEEAQDQAESGVPVNTPASGGYASYKYYSEIDKSQEKYPQLKDDIDDQIAITALMNAQGLSPLAAADKYYSKMNRAIETAKIEGAKEKEATISEKENAQTVTSTTITNSDEAEYEDILRRTRNQNNPKDANKAHLELIKWKEAHR